GSARRALPGRLPPTATRPGGRWTASESSTHRYTARQRDRPVDTFRSCPPGCRLFRAGWTGFARRLMISAGAIPLDQVPRGPVTSFRCRVEDSWIDFNDHMNAMYYGIIVYRGQSK